MSRRRRVWLALAVAGLAVRLAVGAEAPAADGRTPLPIVLPKPAFVGTPAFLVSPNLEPPSGRLRGPFLAPAGTLNVARGRPVRGSDPAPTLGRYSQVTDGSKEADGESFVEMHTGSQWVQIDLGAVYALQAVVVWHYHAGARVYRDVIVQVGVDPDLAAAPHTLFSNDHDNSSGLGVGRDREYVDTFEGRLIPAAGASGRYVRLYSHGSTTDDMNHCLEVEVYATPAAP